MIVASQVASDPAIRQKYRPQGASNEPQSRFHRLLVSLTIFAEDSIME